MAEMPRCWGESGTAPCKTRSKMP
ncbi:rCG27346, isoform CRA_a, partial [Rattus norvegicus]